MTRQNNIIDKTKNNLIRNKNFYSNLMVFLVFFVSLIQTISKAYRPHGYDLSAYLYAANALLNGTDPYFQDLPFPYIYPLFLAFIITPLTFLPYWLINVLWFLFSIAGIAITIFTAKKIVEYTYNINVKEKLHIIMLLSLLICFSPIHNTLLNGQINLFIVSSVILFFWFHMNKKIFYSAIFLSIATATKLTPGIFFVFLLFRKDYKTLIYSALITIFMLLSPAFICGDMIISYYKFYLNNFILHTFSNGEILNKKLTDISLGFNLQNVISLSFPYLLKFTPLKVFSYLFTVSLVALGECLAINKDNNNSKIFLFILYCCTSLFLSPMGENHHTVILFPAILMFCYILFGMNKELKKLTPFFTIFSISFMLLPGILGASTYYYIPILLLTLLAIYSIGKPIITSSN